MNADMLNRGTEDAPLSLSLSLFLRGRQRPLLPPLDPQSVILRRLTTSYIPQVSSNLSLTGSGLRHYSKTISHRNLSIHK